MASVTLHAMYHLAGYHVGAVCADVVCRGLTHKEQFSIFKAEVLVNGAAADFGHMIELGDRVQTGPGASVEIVFDRQNIFRLGENTVAILNVDENIRSVEVRTGIFNAVFDRLRAIGGQDAPRFSLRTPTVVGGVRGTSFYTRVIDDDTTYVCVCNGSVEAEGVDDNRVKTTIAAAEHEAYMFRRNGDVVTMENADVIYHANEDMDYLADKIEVAIPWGVIPGGRRIAP